jgi:hypothetical protein
VRDLGAVLEATAVAEPTSPVDDRPLVETTTALRERITGAFARGRALELRNVVTNNATGRPILKKGRTQLRAMTGVSEIRRVEGGTLLIRSGLQIDADGSADSKSVDPDHGQVDTSLRWRDAEGRRHSFNTHEIPFFVLPLNWYAGQGVALGDVAAVIRGDRVEYAVFADVGPWRKMGEGSIALHDNLGNNPWTKSGKPWNGIEDTRAVTLVVFPGSRAEAFPGSSPDTSTVVPGPPDLGRIREVGQQRLEALLGARVGVEARSTPNRRPGS